MSEWVTVPVEPTEEMLDRGFGINRGLLRRIYKAMLAVAPRSDRGNALCKKCGQHLRNDIHNPLTMAVGAHEYDPSPRPDDDPRIRELEKERDDLKDRLSVIHCALAELLPNDWLDGG